MCGVARDDDLPGALIPERYFAYLRSRRGELLRAVVEHNRQDIVSLGLLLAVLADGCRCREAGPRLHPGDLSAWRVPTRDAAGIDEALRCVEAALSAARAWALGCRGRRSAASATARPSVRGCWPGWAGEQRRTRRGWRSARAADRAQALPGCTSRATASTSRATSAARLRRAEQAVAIAERARAWGEPMTPVETRPGAADCRDCAGVVSAPAAQPGRRSRSLSRRVAEVALVGGRQVSCASTDRLRHRGRHGQGASPPFRSG